MRIGVDDWDDSKGAPNVTVSYPHPVTGLSGINGPTWTPHVFVACDYCLSTVWGIDGADPSICELGLRSDGWTTTWEKGSATDRCPACNGVRDA